MSGRDTFWAVFNTAVGVSLISNLGEVLKVSVLLGFVFFVVAVLCLLAGYFSFARSDQ